MSHRNNLRRWEEQRWAESLADVAQDRADDYPPTEPPTPAPPWPVKHDAEFLDALEDQGRLAA